MVVYRHARFRLPTETGRISLFLHIGQGAGLATASGVRPFLPPLLAGALARGNIGLDFDGTSFAFLEQPAFLLAVLGLAVVAYALERRRVGDRYLRGGLLAIAVLLGALLFAGSLAEGGSNSIAGLAGGAACAALAFAAVSGLLSRARKRLDAAAAAILPVYADVVALTLAGLAILIPPVSFLALAAFVLLLIRASLGGGRKYEGLRILR